MVSKILPLLCLGLCLGYEDEKKHEKLPKPQLHALPSSEIKRHSSVTFRCQSEVQNVTFMLGKLQDSGYRREQNTGRQDAEFLLVNLDSEDAGQYFCAYRTTVSQEWSEESDHLQLTVTDDRGGRGPPPAKTGADLTLWSCSSSPRHQGHLRRRLQLPVPPSPLLCHLFHLQMLSGWFSTRRIPPEVGIANRSPALCNSHSILQSLVSKRYLPRPTPPLSALCLPQSLQIPHVNVSLSQNHPSQAGGCRFMQAGKDIRIE
ncbi:V-set and transmembrane domain-containing protein 1 isoform X1 [Sus scrofa]|uniref:V-set and transmembrane domain-containing protein 1 isoform X1 n=2 Tax=Sus scrofa TaxID=9823 RepID=UPI000A2B0215|nr:V-set and transmembrane domain-containing protein 1 isoform X1 [Sus scrofa]